MHDDDRVTFKFPGFTQTREQDTPNHWVDVGTIETAGRKLTVTMLLSKNYPFNRHLVASVASADGKPLWTFKQVNGYEDLNGVLVQADETTVIALVERKTHGRVVQVVPVHLLGTPQQPELRRLVALKKAAAEELDCGYVLTAIESKVLAADGAKAAAELATAEKAERERRAAAKAAKIAAIKLRQKITAFTADGQKRFGLPVLAGEWQVLGNGTYVVVVESIDENGKPGKPIEAFCIEKRPGQHGKKVRAVAVTAEPPMSTAQLKAPKSVGDAFFETEQGAFAVVLYGTMEDVKLAVQCGLNGGTFVAVKGVPDEPNHVFAAHDGKLKDVGTHVLK